MSSKFASARPAQQLLQKCVSAFVLAQLTELAMLAAENGTPLSDEWHEQYNAIKARQAKQRKTAAAEVVLTEQSDI